MAAREPKTIENTHHTHKQMPTKKLKSNYFVSRKPNEYKYFEYYTAYGFHCFDRSYNDNNLKKKTTRIILFLPE